MKKFYGIQYLRAAAALGVVCFHAAERTGGHFAIGAAGVDVFFVISGFLMWVISETQTCFSGAVFPGSPRARRAGLLDRDLRHGGRRAGRAVPQPEAHARTCVWLAAFHSPSLTEHWRYLAGARAGLDAELRDVLLLPSSPSLCCCRRRRGWRRLASSSCRLPARACFWTAAMRFS